MTIFRLAVTAVLLSFLTFTTISCDQGPAEKAGEKIDKTVEKTGERVEKAGEAREEKTEEANEAVKNKTQ